MSSFERCVVLVADDEPSILNLVTRILMRHGYIVLPASDGVSALRICKEREEPIHLALLDVMMPGMTGPELFECLLPIHPKLQVLFMSGFRSEQIAGLSLDSGIVHFIAKPFFPADLVQRINAILGNEEVCTLLEEEAIAHA